MSSRWSRREAFRFRLAGAAVALGVVACAAGDPSSPAGAQRERVLSGAASLPSFNVDLSATSVSGLSSGAFMAVQLGVAYSSLFARGVGVIAGGPYDCARQRNWQSCIYDATPDVSQSVANMKSWSGNQIDDVANIAKQRIYLFTGTNDVAVGPNVVSQLDKLYGSFTASKNIRFDDTNPAVHTFPTDFDSPGDNACNSMASPYVSNCNFDGAGAALEWIYGSLNARNNGTLGGQLVEFDQTQFVSNPGAYGMDTTGWVYVPADCAAGKTCRVHVALHGCSQSYSQVGADFVSNTGFNRWADSNDIIVLYPQAVADNTSHTTTASGSGPNPYACWDFIGWYGNDFDQRTGVQVAAIASMVKQLGAGSASPDGGAPPPSDAGFGGYGFDAGLGGFGLDGGFGGFGFDAGLTSGTSCWSDTNANHKAAGRAVSYGASPDDTYFADGSWGYMGTGDGTMTTLLETGANTFVVVASCP